MPAGNLNEIGELALVLVPNTEAVGQLLALAGIEDGLRDVYDLEGVERAADEVLTLIGGAERA